MLHSWGTDATDSLYFVHAATLGLNVEFARLATDASRRSTLGSLTYPASSLEALTHLRAIPVRVQLSGVPVQDPDAGQRSVATGRELHLTLTTEVLQLAVVNTPLFGGTLNLWLPGVDAHDHLLDVFLVESPRLDKGLDSARSALERLPVLRGLHRRRKPIPPAPPRDGGDEHTLADVVGDTLFPGIRRYRARAVSIETATPAQLTLDGELSVQTPVQIRVEPSALAVLLPRRESGVAVSSASYASSHSSNEELS
jgi:diacylglycerol kinase family enzyme